MLRLIPRNERMPGFPRPDWAPDALYRLFSARGLDSEQQMLDFLSPNLEQLYDERLLSGIDRALSMIEAAKNANVTICVYGDYDVDGVCASAIVINVLTALGMQVRSYIPSRHGEGYGLNMTAIKEIAEWAGLLITVDCGVSSVDEVALCNELELPVIVTDHHRPADVLPDCPIVNPLMGRYPFPSLCGAGVALKLMMAIDRELALQQLDLAALATVADLVPLIDENRAIVALGLDRIKENPRTGLVALSAVAGIRLDSLKAGSVAFGLAPRLNAGGRLGDAGRSLALLLEQDMPTAEAMARELEAENHERRSLEAGIVNDALDQLKDVDLFRRYIIVLHGENWNPGVIGIAASRIVEKYHLPCILLSGSGDELTGSCRSIPGVDIHQALTHCATLFVRYGGHKQAAGLTISVKNVARFTDMINLYLAQHADKSAYIPSAEYDIEMPICELTENVVNALSKMEPFGFGNPTPVILTRAQVMNARTVGTDGTHLSLRLRDDNGAQMSAIGFRMAGRLHQMKGYVRLLHQPKLNEYNGRVSVQMELKAIAPPQRSDIISNVRANWDAMLHVFLTERVYNWAYSHQVPVNPESRPLIECHMGAEDVARRLGKSPYGMLVVVTDLAALDALIEACEQIGLEDGFDLSIGEWSKGDMAQNTVCILPRGELPKGYARIVALDAPVEILGIEGYLIEPVSPDAAWLGSLPTVSELRTLYQCVRDLAARPLMMWDIETVLQSLAQDGRISGIATALGLPILWDMGLIELTLEPPRLAMLPVKKSDPEQDRIYRWLHELRMLGR